MRMPVAMVVVGAALMVAAVISHDVHEANMVALARDAPLPAEPKAGQAAYPRNAAFSDAMRGGGGAARTACFVVGVALAAMGVLAEALSAWSGRRQPGSAGGARGEV